MTQIDSRVAEDLDRLGYCCVENALSPEQLNALSEEINRIASEERRDGNAWFSHGNQRIFNLVGKSEVALRLVSHDITMELLNHLLGPQALLSSITANIARPGNTSQQLHADQGYIPMPWPRVEAMNVIWVIDPFTRENGATRIIPGSHRFDAPPSEDAFAVSLEAPGGSAICLDGRLWHGTGANGTDATYRRAIFAYYCRPYLRQQENFCRSLPRELLPRLTATERRLLGFDIWEGLGAVNGLPVSWMDGRARIGPTNQDRLFPAVGEHG